MNAGDTYEIHGCYNSPWPAILNKAWTCLFLYVIQVKWKCTNPTAVEDLNTYNHRKLRNIFFF
jgi:hypothetical protein